MKQLCVFSSFAFLLTLFSCNINKPVERRLSDNNETFTVDYLFEHEGCKVYRFRDDGQYVYFTNCTGDVTSFSSDSVKTRIENSVKTYKRNQPFQ